MTTNDQTTPRPRPFRFGVVAPLRTDVATWRDAVRRLADLGFATLLVPDVPQWQPAPGPMLAVAATLTDLRVGTWVHASPLRNPGMLAWEAHSLSVLTEGRFELGMGTGRPDIDDELRRLGLPVVPPRRRLELIGECVAALRELDGAERRTPVAMAVRGPRALALAAQVADTVNVMAMPGDARGEIVRVASGLRTERDVELALHVPVVGETVAPFMAGPATDAAALHAEDSLLALPGDPSAATEELLRRREEGGFSYVVVGANAAGTLAPVVAELAGR